MEIHALTAFVEVARTGSFSVAAEHLFLTQPAVSKRVAALESELGTPLFDRIGRKVTLTEAGNALLPQASRLLQEAAEMKRLAASLTAGVSGTLNMGTSHHIGLHRLPPVLRAFTRAYPEAQLDIDFMDSEAACRAVEAGDLELAVVTLPNQPSDALGITPLWQDRLVFMVHRDHPLAGETQVTLQTLAAHRAVLPGPSTYTRGILTRALAGAGLKLQVAMSTNYLETLKMLVATGLGWSLLPATMLDEGVTELPVPLQLSRQLGIVIHRKRTLSNAARAMVETCISQAGKC